jgi:hypothetical protein
LVKTVFTDTYWAVAGVDLSLLACAGIAVWAARQLARREQLQPAPVAAPSPASASEGAPREVVHV